MIPREILDIIYSYRRDLIMSRVHRQLISTVKLWDPYTCLMDRPHDGLTERDACPRCGIIYYFGTEGMHRLMIIDRCSRLGLSAVIFHDFSEGDRAYFCRDHNADFHSFTGYTNQEFQLWLQRNAPF